MTNQELATKALACLVLWRCASQECRHELHEVPADPWVCPRCGTRTPCHGLFSDDREGLLHLLQEAAGAQP